MQQQVRWFRSKRAAFRFIENQTEDRPTNKRTLFRDITGTTCSFGCVRAFFSDLTVWFPVNAVLEQHHFSHWFFSFLLSQKWKNVDVCYLNFVPGCDSYSDKCTVTKDQSNSDQLHTLRFVHTDTHINASTPLQTQTDADVYTSPPLCRSVVGLSWFPVRQPDQWAWSCSLVVPLSTGLPPPSPLPPSSV